MNTGIKSSFAASHPNAWRAKVSAASCLIMRSIPAYYFGWKLFVN
ncbi:hypothetical protein RGAI101_3346 [Roseobacter sp. GAI101]|nr:hypothetical protein RGAI101_3346 [Roseobacter sp. GAI101]